jgi:hypothetical protein
VEYLSRISVHTKIPSGFFRSRDIKPFFPRAKLWTSSLKRKPVN